jgi:hypothetical protein
VQIPNSSVPKLLLPNADPPEDRSRRYSMSDRSWDQRHLSPKGKYYVVALLITYATR